MGSAAASLGEMMGICENKLGFRPYVVLIDVARETSQPITAFTGVDQVLVCPANPENLNLLLSNFRDAYNFDIYTALQSIAKTNRYDLVDQLMAKATANTSKKVEK